MISVYLLLDYIMFCINESDRFLLFTRTVDLRKGVDPLSILVRSNSLCPTDGSVYVFLNRSRNRMKLLHWERGGYVIFYKRMEQGRISPTVFHDTGKALFMHYRWDEMVLLVEGISGSVKRSKRYNISNKV